MNSYASSSSSSKSPGRKSLSGSSWEDLHKEARNLENQIDLKLIALGKLGSSAASSQDFGDSKTPLLASTDDSVSASDQLAELAGEIDTLLARLISVNASLSDWADRQPHSAAVHHTLQRHRDILQDYRQEFTKTKSNLTSVLQRHDLLNGGSSQQSSSQGSTNIRMDLLLKESEHARNSERLIDDQINIAIEARETLVNQRLAFKAIQTKLNDISNRFPVINNLMQRINLRKRRDAIILAVIIGLCLTFLLWWIMT